MYAAHAEKKRQEESQLELHNCISLLEKAVSDNDRFSAILEITKHIRFNTFTNNDREKVVSAMGFEFLSKLITISNLPEECPSNLYKSIALSMLSTICMEPSVVYYPHIKTFIKEINSVLVNNKHTERDKTLLQMKSDGLNVLLHIAEHPTGVELLVAHDSFDFLLKFINESGNVRDPDISKALTIVGTIVKKKGNGALYLCSDKLNFVMDTVSQIMKVGSDIQEKIEYAKAITMILESTSMVPVEISCPWVRNLASTVGKLLIVKLAPEDSEVFFYLFVALVSHFGCDLLNIDGLDRVNLVKVVVARVTVEVYMLLDGIGPSNASSRFSRLNKVYRLLSDLVQFVCGDFGESADTDTIILLYRKLVDISNTVMEFLSSIASQDVDLPKNHSVVLISVRVLAAMLSEITEDPSPTLFKLLPFFNLLCQNVEYSDDVKMEVKNVMQGALENIKMMSLHSIDEDGVENSPLASARSNTDQNIDEKQKMNFSIDVNGAEQVQNSDETVYLNDSDTPRQAESDEWKHRNRSVKSAFVDTKKSNDLRTSLFFVPNSRSEAQTDSGVIDLETHSSGEEKIDNNKNKLKEDSDPALHQTNISISNENVEEFLAYQEQVKVENAKSAIQRNRQRSIARQVKRMKHDVECSDEEKKECDAWKLSPNDILGFLLPSYCFLVNHKEAVKIMVECDAFQTIVNFVEESTSQTLAGKSSSSPESTTVNALEVIRLLFTENAEVASTLLCLLDFFEIAILSVPNLVNMPNPPPLMCLKVIEVSLVALRFYKKSRKRNSSLHRIKHSRSRYFKSVIDYLLSFYVIKHHRVNGLSLHIAHEFKDVWTMANNHWCGCLDGLNSLVKSMEDLQEMLVKTPMLSQFLTFLVQCKSFDVNKAPEDRKKIIESYFDLIETSASASNALRGFIVHSKGVLIARKFKLTKLEELLDANQGNYLD